ncbi:hypothetical protein G6F68_018007 [Rhizopus microsporus]|nr:hypothetical protein G6F68_018007 [Rhizopus microsporus]
MEAMLAEAIGEDLDALSEAMPYGWAEALCGPARLAATHLQDGEDDNKLLALLDWTEELPPDAEPAQDGQQEPGLSGQVRAQGTLCGVAGSSRRAGRLGAPPERRARHPGTALH